MQQYECIMLIDDDSINNFINERLIKKLKIGNNIKIFVNGESALDFLTLEASGGKDSPELIFLDINMPMMNGFEFLEKFNELVFNNKDKAKIIGLTTSTHPKDIEKLKLLNCHQIINKPLTEENLKSVLKNTIIIDENRI